MTLLAVPNVSEGRDARTLDALAAAFTGPGVAQLDTHVDPDHHRTVFTLASAQPGRLAAALAAGAREAMARIDLTDHAGQHPRVGVLDVAPIVYLDEADRGAACAEALVLGDELGRLGLPVYLYGSLGGGRTRAQLRAGSGTALDALTPDFGPRARHATAGATLVSARPPLIAFNVELAPPATLADARAIAAAIREGGAQGLPGVRAIGLALDSQELVQVSTNVEDFRTTSPAEVVAAVAQHATVLGAELVALAPEAAYADFPADVTLRGLRTIEVALAAVPGHLD